MGNKVLASLENSYGDLCVDIFARRDPEDGGRWFNLHRYSSQVFAREEEAVAQARASVPWLKSHEEK
jgi:hypothetical protein